MRWEKIQEITEVKPDVIPKQSTRSHHDLDLSFCVIVPNLSGLVVLKCEHDHIKNQVILT